MILPDNASLSLAIPTDGERLDVLYPPFLRRSAAAYAFVGGNALIRDTGRSYEEQKFLNDHEGQTINGHHYNTAADPDAPLGHLAFFVGTEYELSGDGIGSRHMLQKLLKSTMFPNPAGWAIATDWNYGDMDLPTRARFNACVSWNAPGFRVWKPLWTGLCRRVPSSKVNPDGEHWHVEPDPRVARTIFDLPAEVPDMTDDERRMLNEAHDWGKETVLIARRLRTELLGPDGDDDPKALVPRIAKQVGA